MCAPTFPYKFRANEIIIVASQIQTFQTIPCQYKLHSHMNIFVVFFLLQWFNRSSIFVGWKFCAFCFCFCMVRSEVESTHALNQITYQRECEARSSKPLVINILLFYAVDCAWCCCCCCFMARGFDLHHNLEPYDHLSCSYLCATFLWISFD